MARIEVVCPFCRSLQTVPQKRLHDAWVCMKCRGTIEDPFLHKKKSPAPQLQIPLHGKIISASGITNLSEIVASSEEYSKGFDDTVAIPGSFDIEHYQPPSEPPPRRRDRSGVLAMLLFGVVILAGIGGFVWFVLLPMMK